MVKIHEKFRDEGFQILAFPCNQFLGQESCSNEYIKKHVQEKYGVEFQMMAKVKVNGTDSHEVFKFCRKNSSLYDEDADTLQSIPWNFTKFLIDKDGQVVDFFTPKQDPNA